LNAISIGGAVSSGFGLIRRRPVTVIIWGAVRAALSLATVAMMLPFYGAIFARFAHPGPPAPFDASQMSTIMGLQSLNLLVNLFSAAVGVVLFCATCRAVLRPDGSAFAYLRFGAAEIFVFLFAMVAYILWLIALFIVAIPLVIIIAVLGASHAAPVAAIVGVLGFFAVFSATVYIFTRFCMGGPLILDQGKLLLFDSWALTRGHAGSLFGLSVSLGVVVIGLELVIGAVMLAIGAVIVSAMPGGWQGLMAAFKQSPMTLFTSFAPWFVVLGVVSIPITGAFQAITAAPWASAYRDLTATPPADVFS
jgi:hypothetical protein